MASLAAEAWHGLKGVARPEVLALMREREAAHGEVPRGRDWDSREDWIDADLTVLTAAQGGRKYGIATGYRPNWDIGLRTPSGEVSYADAAVSIDGEPLGPEWGERRIEPGERGSVRLYPLAPEFWYRLLPGQEIRMCEGSRVVGHGVVREVGLAPLF